LTLDYGKKVDALRRRYRKFLWDAEFRDTLGAIVVASGLCRYAVYVAQDGKRGVAVMNLDQLMPITVEVTLPNSGKLEVATPEEQDAKPSTGSLSVPPRSAVVLMEV
jgi:hypothetical protein